MTFSPSGSEIIVSIRIWRRIYLIHVIGVSFCIRHIFNTLKSPSHFVTTLIASIHQGGKVDGVIVGIRPVLSKRFWRSGAETVLIYVCALGNSCIDTSVGIQIHRTPEVRKEQTAFHCPVATLHDKAASSHIIQKKWIAPFQSVIIFVSAVSNNRTHINTFPLLAGSLCMCLCFQSHSMGESYDEKQRVCL